MYSEYILDFFAVWLTKFYNTVTLIPRWLLVFASGTIGSLLISVLHKPPKPSVAPQPQSNTTVSTPTVSNDVPAQSDGESVAKRTGAKQRKPKS